MKKLMFLAIALFAFTTFTSCEEEQLSDTELVTKIQSYATYDGKDSGDDKLYFRVVSNKYILDYSEISVSDFSAKYAEYEKNLLESPIFSAGTWDVKDGILYLYDADTNTYSGTVESEGKKIVVKTASGGVFATLSK